MIDIDDFTEIRECDYKDEHYSVRDNGAVLRHARIGKRLRKDDNEWTFGRVITKSGYMEIGGELVHRIVAYAYLGAPPTKQHVVDHIDTNRQNNRPENLRWLTRLENVLNNPITRARIENICGSIEAFLANPSLLRGHEKIDPNFAWMRAVTKEEARISLENMQKWARERPKSKGGFLGDWIYKKESFNTFNGSWNKEEQNHRTNDEFVHALTPNVVQVNWQTPSEFPCCPQDPQNNPLEEYRMRLEKGSLFCKNELYGSTVLDSAITEDGNKLIIMTKSTDPNPIKPWALTIVTFKDGIYYHSSGGSFFKEDGVQKYFTLEQGKEWKGGNVFDDYC